MVKEIGAKIKTRVKKSEESFGGNITMPENSYGYICDIPGSKGAYIEFPKNASHEACVFFYMDDEYEIVD